VFLAYVEKLNTVKLLRYLKKTWNILTFLLLHTFSVEIIQGFRCSGAQK